MVRSAARFWTAAALCRFRPAHDIQKRQPTAAVQDATATALPSLDFAVYSKVCFVNPLLRQRRIAVTNGKNMTQKISARRQVRLVCTGKILQSGRMKAISRIGWFYAAIACLTMSFCIRAVALPSDAGAEIRTPPAPHTPRINGPDIFGVRPGHPFLYHIPATGDRPMEFSADHLPKGLSLDSATGDITGVLKKRWFRHHYGVTLHAKNSLGEAKKKFKIVVGETISLTPAMGWNSWNHYASRITQALVVENAKAMADSGLINYGWTYINVDDTWQGARGGPFHAIQGNEKFPDMKAMCAAVHALGLKVGIYSTPWTTSYANHIGGSSENPEGTWSPPTISKHGHINNKTLPWAIGQYHFTTNDADQWAAWGMDYLKYDWNPIEYPETKEMYDALRHSGRDIVFSLSNNMNITNAPAISKIANSWRTTGDIKANWKSMTDRGFGQQKWRRFCSPGHWNDPDMLEIANAEHNQPGLTPDEEYTHMTLWCLDAAPLLLGNDLTAMDKFTLNVLENYEVLAVDQDALGDQAVAVAKDGDTRVLAKNLEDGSKAVGLFNLNDDKTATVTVKWSDLKIHGSREVRDLWRQKDLGKFKGEFSMQVAPHSAELVKISR
jgi:alpha-galactosidase